MAKSYEQIQADIVALQAKAEQIRQKEAAGVIKQIKEAIAYYGLTAADLGLDGETPARKTPTRKTGSVKSAPKKSKAAGRVSKKRAAKSAKRSEAAAIKYRDDAGNTWSGRGPRPGWFKDALAQGRSAEDMLA